MRYLASNARERTGDGGRRSLRRLKAPTGAERPDREKAMATIRSITLRRALPAALLLAAACAESSAPELPPEIPEPPPRAGTAAVVVEQVGRWTDVDGFVVVVDGTRRLAFGTSNAFSRSRLDIPLAPGRHQLTLEEVAPNCVAERPSREVELADGAALRLDFRVACQGATLRVQLRVASGEDADPDGYGVRLSTELRGEIAALRAPLVRDTVLIVDVPAEPIAVAVEGLWPNCNGGATSAELAPRLGAMADLEVVAACRPLPSGGIVYAWEGKVLRLLEGSSEPVVLGDGMMPAWSPDGSRIAFVRSTTEGCASYSCLALFTMRPNGREVVRVASDVAWPGVRYLADGRIVTGRAAQLWRPDGGTAPLPWGAGVRPQLLDWSPDLSVNLLRRWNADSTSSLLSAATDGSDARELFGPRGDVTSARLLPGGRLALVQVESVFDGDAYFARLLKPCDPADCGAWLVDLATGGRERFEAARPWEVHAFSPDGARALVTRWDEAGQRSCLVSVALTGTADPRPQFCHFPSYDMVQGADWR
jgi:hypothetical protein